MKCKPLGSSKVCTGRATPRWIAWPTQHFSNDAKILQLQCAQLKDWKLFGQICFQKCDFLWKTNLSPTLMIWILWFQFHHQRLWGDFSKIIAHITIAQCAKLSVTGAWLIFRGGENNICQVVYACECFQVMYIDSCARVRTLVRSRLYVGTSMTTDSHMIRTCECILRQRSL